MTDIVGKPYADIGRIDHDAPDLTAEQFRALAEASTQELGCVDLDAPDLTAEQFSYLAEALKALKKEDCVEEPRREEVKS